MDDTHVFRPSINFLSPVILKPTLHLLRPETQSQSIQRNILHLISLPSTSFPDSLSQSPSVKKKDKINKKADPERNGVKMAAGDSIQQTSRHLSQK